jgi:hypothetical protein
VLAIHKIIGDNQNQVVEYPIYSEYRCTVLPFIVKLSILQEFNQTINKHAHIHMYFKYKIQGENHLQLHDW